MPITINGTGTIAGLSVGGLPDGTVQPADLSTGAPYWDTSGNVGIGITPSDKLNVSDGTVNIQMIPTSAGSIGYVGTRSSHALGFTVGNSERARIDSSGRVLIGTSSPLASASARVQIDGVSSGGEAMIVKNTQYLISFMNSSNGYVGSIQTSGTTTSYNTSSDYRLKYDTAPLTGALAKVSALKPCTYKWKTDNSDGEGFIAHELAEVVPQCVTGEKDATDADGNPIYQGIDTSFLVATLTAAIQELNQKVEAQAVEIAALKGAA